LGCVEGDAKGQRYAVRS